MKRFHLALVLSILYLVAGNATAIAAMYHPSNRLLNSRFTELLFIPYSFTASLSTFAGWDWLSFVFEAVAFAITIPFFFIMIVIFSNVKAMLKERK